MGNNIEQPNSNTGNEAVIPSHTTCCTMGPRVREDDKIRKEKTELSSATKNKKLSTPPPRPQPSFPCTRESIHPHTPDAAFGNALTAIGNNIEQPNNTGSKAVTPNYTTCCTMDPRVREDDELRDGSKKQTETATTEVKR
ncbi:TPA: hypothetical protein I7234_20460 [Vibrio vulnificus]|nr:hypothetical protein [Vibrio vulnificus]HDY7612342.1 hypothetical protein [Vibrio vulnificus]